MKQQLQINGRPIGPGHPTYIIAEMSGNHNQSLDRAVQILEAAAQAGADAVKLQTYTPDTLTIDCDNEYFQIGKGTVWQGRKLYDLYGEASTPWAWQPQLKRIADDLGVHLFSTPFDATAVDFLEGMDVPAYKIASFEVVDLALLARVAQTGKPIIMSTGMANLDEIDDAVNAIRNQGNEQLALLKCTSAYPTPPSEMNLRTIPHLAERYQLPVGLSDHTLDIVVPVTAVALGGCIIEKHFTLSRQEGGPDSTFSLEPYEFRAMVDAVRTTEAALGKVNYEVTESEVASRVFRRSLFVVQDMEPGDIFSEHNVRSIRPGYGLAPKYLPSVLGRTVTRPVLRGTPLSWEIVD